jgi:hypothetical protein
MAIIDSLDKEDMMSDWCSVKQSHRRSRLYVNDSYEKGKGLVFDCMCFFVGTFLDRIFGKYSGHKSL